MILVPLFEPEVRNRVCCAVCANFGFGALGIGAAGRYFSFMREWFVRVRGFEARLRLRKYT